ncbi:response regulator transcription factor [Buchananella felis]|uniref:response regulator transcription factor n=1 Tax=Buchananella felis TaxID=3231492 RepID=UPI0035296B36
MRVLIVDPSIVVRAGLRELLSRCADDLSIYEARDCSQAMRVAGEVMPDMVLLDFSPDLVELFRCLQELARTASVIMITEHHEQALIERAMASGATGCLVLGKLNLRQVSDAIAAAQRRRLSRLRQPNAQAVVQPELPQRVNNKIRLLLTRREAEVLQLASSGLTNAQIAERLFLSLRTVRNYLNSAYPKLRVHNRAQAVAAWRAGETTLPSGPIRGGELGLGGVSHPGAPNLTPRRF